MACRGTGPETREARNNCGRSKMSFGKLTLLSVLLCCGTWVFAQAAPATPQANEAGGSPQPGAMNTEEGTPGMATLPNTTLPNAAPSMPDRYHPNHPPTGVSQSDVTAPGTNPGQSSHGNTRINSGKHNSAVPSGTAKSAQAKRPPASASASHNSNAKPRPGKARVNSASTAHRTSSGG